MKRTRRSPAKDAPTTKRTWAASVTIAVAIVVAADIVSAAVNPLLGRTVHWDWMAGLTTILFVGLLLSFRNRWL